MSAREALEEHRDRAADRWGVGDRQGEVGAVGVLQRDLHLDFVDLEVRRQAQVAAGRGAGRRVRDGDGAGYTRGEAVEGAPRGEANAVTAGVVGEGGGELVAVAR